MKIKLDHTCAKDLTFQSYGPQQPIEGVFCQPLRKHRAAEGWFMEHLRLTGGAVEAIAARFEVRQVSFSKALPGRINAFHIHPLEVQDELWTVVDGAMLVWLVDLRASSPTKGVRMQFYLNAEAPELLYIPTGVAHGYKASPQGALLAYVMNSQFDLKAPNEGRLPWDYFGAQIWEEDRG